jgi:hypothetical protein
MRDPNPTTLFYQVKPGQEGWARIWITNDGSFACISDWGNWGHWWGAPGCEFRRFLIGRDDSYLAGCFMHGDDRLERKARAFLKNVWPLFVELLRAELATEAA